MVARSGVRRLRNAMVVAALAIVGLLVLRASQRSPFDLSWLDRTVLHLTSPIESAFTRAMEGTARAFRNYVWLVDTKRESERLRADNERLRGELSRARLAEARASRLEQTLGLRASLPAETLAARVVGVDTSPLYRVVRVQLDRGRGEVKPDMVVLVPDGIVGRVGRVAGGYSEVRLAVDPDSAIDVMVPRTGARGVLRGVAATDAYGAVIPNMPRADEVKEGDEVVTSGIGGLPRDLTVGRVTRVLRPDSGLWQKVEVAPAVDFAKLSEVLIVLSAPPPPDPDFHPDLRRSPLPGRGMSAPR